ncbi:MAG: hypothetical protein V1913_13185 [Fibrobacterota bacterium]
MAKPLLILFAVACLGTAAFAEGTAEFEYIPRGARADAMGGTGCAAPADAFAPFYNPAGPALLKDWQAAFEYAPLWDQGDNFTSFAAVLPLPQNRLAMAASYSRFQTGDIPYFGELEGGDDVEARNNNIALRSSGVPLGAFTASSDLLSLSLAKWTTRELSQEVFYKLTVPVTLSAGGAFKFYRQNFAFDPALGQPDYEGHALDIDLGGLLAFTLDKDLNTGLPTKSFSAGMTLKNALRSSVAYNSSRNYEDPGERIRLLGFAYTHALPAFSSRAVLTLDLVRRADEQVQRFGAEYAFRELLFLRAGYLDHGTTAGVGIQWRFVRVDYSYRYHELSSTPYRISLNIRRP